MKLAPRDFWSLSLVEWRAMTAPRAAPALSRGELETLMQRYPD